MVIYITGLTKKVNLLTFRHTFTTHMYEASVTMKDINEMLGHDDETETTVYVHIRLVL
ncbi:MAG: tyrosine-type recombinase/integrase [Desulfosarcina sp.]|nr:tyrosine-type recombinase/integrase [Desulfobacterales bacterium]